MRTNTNTAAKQRTFEVNGQRITLRSTRASVAGMGRGWYVRINGKRYFRNCLERQQAEDSAYVAWVREQPE